MIGIYVNKSIVLHIEFLETFQINNQTILNFVYLWSKEVPLSLSYPIIVNPIRGYFDARIVPSCVRYIITKSNQCITKKMKNRSQVGDVHRLLNIYIDRKWQTIYVNEGHHLPYF